MEWIVNTGKEPRQHLNIEVDVDFFVVLPIMCSMRYIVTGGAGFIGSHLCERLLQENHEVVAVDNFITGQKENVAHLLPHPGFSLLEQDITRPFDLPGKVDRILHFASPASPIDYLELPMETLTVGGVGTHHCLELARQKQARILFASTSEVYGDPLVHPQTEDYWGNVNPIGPRSVYDEAKRYSEALTMAYHRTFNVETRIVRIFNTYGPRMRANDGRVVCTFITQALRKEDLTVFGEGLQTRSFCYVDDLVTGILNLMESEETMPVNIGNPDEIPIIQFAREILDLMGSSVQIQYRPLPQDDPKQRKPDITRAREILNWEPKVPRKEGLKKTIEYFQNLSD